MTRVFVYDDREFPDPDPQMSVDQVKSTLSDFYGEIANASVKETTRGGRTPSTSSSGGWAPRAHPLLEIRREHDGHQDPCESAGGGAPPADLRLIELTAELTRPDGSLDLDAAASRSAEMELACAQAQDYAAATGRLAKVLRWQLQPRRT